ncbi:MAG: hypothetical protein R3F41_00370 [Gammaproteobacteria bacterium]|nr:hypothetical protein [Pseudomonadales bacterium]MCP5346237.1 hypothetical protein [Pseudomonadales bacterium]
MKPYLFLGCLLASCTSPHFNETADTKLFSCDGLFSANPGPEELADLFGSENLSEGEIDVGEGISEPGTLLFEQQLNQKIAILWDSQEQKHRIRQVRISGEASSWATESGISLGSSLNEIEGINREPFRLSGFGWDYGGTVTSWGSGVLRNADAGNSCRLTLRLAPASDLTAESGIADSWYSQVLGEREYSSDHPAMQALNPEVYEMILSYEL